MIKIKIKNLPEKEVQSSNAATLLTILHENQQDWMHACGGKGRCTTCKAVVIEGAAHLGPLTPFENNFVQQGRLKENERLACQVEVHDDISIIVPDICKLPHLNYSF